MGPTCTSECATVATGHRRNGRNCIGAFDRNQRVPYYHTTLLAVLHTQVHASMHAETVTLHITSHDFPPSTKRNNYKGETEL